MTVRSAYQLATLSEEQAAPYKDRVFLVGRLDMESWKNGGNCIVRLSDEQGSLAVMREEDRATFFGDDLSIPTVREIRNLSDNTPDENGEVRCLVSGGGFAWVRDQKQQEARLIVLERNGSVAVGQLTDASGLADGSPLRTLRDEVNEEYFIGIPDSENQTIHRVSFGADKTWCEALQTAQDDNVRIGLEEASPHLKNFQVVAGDPRYAAALQDEPALSQKVVIRGGAGDEILEEFEGFVTWEERYNTLCLRRAYEITVPDLDELVFLDPERLLSDDGEPRRVFAKTGEEMAADSKVLESTEAYLKARNPGLYMK